MPGHTARGVIHFGIGHSLNARRVALKKIGRFLKTADDTEVRTLCISAESREWGYNPAPDGTPVEFVSYSEIAWGRTRNYGKKPGIYENVHWVNVRLPSQEIINVWSGNFQPRFPYVEGKFLRELPDTSLWEEDEVLVNNSNGKNQAGRVLRLNMPNDTLPSISYDIQLSEGGCYSFQTEKALTLTARGPVWKFYHGETLAWRTVQEEADFFVLIGHSEDIKNPVTHDYHWPHLHQVLSAIRAGEAHAFTASHGRGLLFYGSPGIQHRAIKFRDENVGRRVAAATLAGFPSE